MTAGSATAYSIDKLQDRGQFFIEPGEEIYTGMVIGEHNRQNDIEVNVQTAKQLTNMRASGSDNTRSFRQNHHTRTQRSRAVGSYHATRFAIRPLCAQACAPRRCQLNDPQDQRSLSAGSGGI